MKSTWAGAVLVVALASPRVFAQGFVQELDADPGSFHGQFGYSEAADGDTMVTGDPDYVDEANPCFKEHGAITIYQRTAGTWQSPQLFKYIADGSARPRLGWSVAIKGDVIVAATPGQDYVNGSTRITDAGALSVYRRPSSTQPFAFAGQAFAPTPVANGEFTSHWPVATNGNYMAATGFPGNPGSVYVYSLANNSIAYVSTIATSLPIITSLFITDRNVLVASFSGATAPGAWALNGSSATAVDMSSMSDASSTVVSPMAGSNNSIAFVRQNGTTSVQTLIAAKLDATTVQSVQAIPLAAGIQSATAGMIAIQEGQGILMTTSASTSAINSYLYAGAFVDMGAIDGFSGLSLLWSMAFSGTDLFIGSGIAHTGQMCTEAGSLFVYRPLLGIKTALLLTTVWPSVL